MNQISKYGLVRFGCLSKKSYITVSERIKREIILSEKRDCIGLTPEETVEWLRLCDDLSDYLDNTFAKGN